MNQDELLKRYGALIKVVAYLEGLQGDPNTVCVSYRAALSTLRDLEADTLAEIREIL